MKPNFLSPDSRSRVLRVVLALMLTCLLVLYRHAKASQLSPVPIASNPTQELKLVSFGTENPKRWVVVEIKSYPLTPVNQK